MATFNFKPVIKVTNYLDKGKYTGTIEKIQFFEDKGYFTFDIITDSVTFNTAFAINNNVFLKFVAEHVDDEGNFVDDQLIGQKVVFAVEDGKTDVNANLRSRVVMIKAI